MTDRNLRGLFFRVSGFTPEETDDIVYRQKQVKQALGQQRERRRQEKKLLNIRKFSKPAPGLDAVIKAKKYITKGKRKNKPERLKEQIQYGRDLAKWWMMQHE